ncbi:MAG: RidA family protein [Coprothermobacterota bacterium]|nr:RidA family protein [Coprothermobacterota bacterium]
MGKRCSFASDCTAPPVGPYSPGVEAGGFIFLSGQIPLLPDGALVEGDIQAQVEQSLKNLKGLLEQAGLDLKAVVKTTIFLTDMADFPAVNEIYARYFSPPFPARSTVAVLALPKGVRVEIEAIALREEG